MKRTELAKNQGLKIAGRIKPFGVVSVPGGAAPAPDRREQRRLDQAQGLVPFACKLNSALVEQLRILAIERGIAVNDLVAELLQKGLARPR